MLKQWIAMEHYRLHTVEEWPDGEHRRAMIAAIRSTLDSLSMRGAPELHECWICQSRRIDSKTIEMPAVREVASTRAAA